MKFGSVNCDNQNNNVCGSFGIRGFPTLKLIAPGFKGTASSAATDYAGARTAGAIANAALGALPNHVRVVKSEDDKLLTGEGAKVLIFSDKAKVSHLARALAVKFRGAADFGLVQVSKVPTVAEQYGVDAAPAIVLVPASGEPATYSGKIEPKKVIGWLSKELGVPAGRAGGAGGKGKKEDAGPPPPPPQDAVWSMRTREDIRERCLDRAGACAIALLDSYATEEDKTAQLAVLDEVLAKHTKKGAFTIVYLDPVDQEDFMRPFGFGDIGGSDLPRLLVVNEKKGYFNRYVGPFEAPRLGEYFGELLLGKIRVSKLNKDLKLAESFQDLGKDEL